MRSPLVKVPSLKHVLLNQLEKALSRNYEDNDVCFTDFSQKQNNTSDAIQATEDETDRLIDRFQSTNPPQIPLHKKQNIAPVLYTSALPQRWAASGYPSVSKTPSEASEKLVAILEQARSSLSSSQRLSIEAQLWLEFQIETHRPGWIAFRLTPAGVNQWLTYLSKASPAPLFERAKRTPQIPTVGCSGLSTQPLAELLWQAQYTHACCCRLLRQVQPPWPQPEKEDAKSSFHTLQEQRLLHALVNTADDLFWIPYRWPTQQYLLLLKSSAPLCQAFERFCRTGFNSLAQQSAIHHSQVEPTRSRFFILILATQNLLKVLLEEHLGEPAPERL